MLEGTCKKGHLYRHFQAQNKKEKEKRKRIE